MDLYSYSLKLIDPLFFAREGISGAFTAPYLHATALNHALTWAMGKERRDQPYFMSEENGGRNSPRYETSWIDENFYATPARLKGTPTYYTEIVKGDGDKNIQVGYGAAKINGVVVGKNEVLKAYRIYSIVPESVFEGYLYSNVHPAKFPSLIRLGSFRGLAIFEIDASNKIIGKEKKKYCDHPVDPLVSKVLRGTPVPMLPYPVVDQALVEDVWEIRRFRQRIFVAALTIQQTSKIEPVRQGASLIL
jgi:CRISPR type I-D-associated protein Csc1